MPLTWYHSATFAFFDDETHTSIRKVYEHPAEHCSKRQFCGYCGTPLSFWCEQPASEAEFIHLTLGSLVQEDLQDLEDMGLIPDEPSDESDEGDKPNSQAQHRASVSPPNKDVALRQSFGVPWFDTLVEGTRLGQMRQTKGIQQAQDGNVNIEWEVVEYSDTGDGDGDEDVEMVSAHSTASGKRKLGERDD